MADKPLVLAVDDAAVNLDMLEDILKQDLHVQAAHNADDACQFYAQEMFDVVLTDLYRKGVSGPAVVE